MTFSQANSLLVLCCIINIIAICVKNKLPALDLLSIGLTTLVAIMVSIVIGKQSNED